MNYQREIKKYLKRVILFPTSTSEEDSLSYGFMQKRIPEKFISEELRKTGRITLSMEGEDLKGFKDILRGLRSDKLTEYLKDKDLEERFWSLFCEVYFHQAKYKKEGALASVVNDFIDEIRKPFKNYELQFSVSNLKLQQDSFIFWEAVFKNVDEDSWNSMNVASLKLTELLTRKKVENDFINKTVLSLTMQGNNTVLVASRARERAQTILRALQVYLRSKMGIQDESLLFELSEYYIIREVDSSDQWYSGWNGKRRPRIMTINNKIKDHVDIASEHFDNIRKTKPELQNRIERAIYWAGMAVDEDLFDHKLVYLCTALESLLTTIDDPRKGEAVTYRMVIVNHIIENRFPEPFKLMAFYELRSRVVHGTALFETTYSDYSVLHYMVRTTIFNFITLVGKFNIKSHTDLLKIIHKNEFIEPVKGYFRGFGGNWPKEILSSMDSFDKGGKSNI